MTYPAQHKQPWYLRESVPSQAIFYCRHCHTQITSALSELLDDRQLSTDVGTSRVPLGHYYQIPEDCIPQEQRFTTQVAVPLSAMREEVYDYARASGCCGPSGWDGPNRLCQCGKAIATEVSDCLWAKAVYLDLSKVRGYPLEYSDSASI